MKTREQIEERMKEIFENCIETARNEADMYDVIEIWGTMAETSEYLELEDELDEIEVSEQVDKINRGDP